MSAKYPNIDYSKIKSSGHTLYLAEKPCNITFMRNYQASEEDDSCVDDFLDFMTDEKIKTVVVLLTDAQIKQYYEDNLIEVYRDEGFNVIHYPIRDFSVPKDLRSFNNMLHEINNKLKTENVLIHCSAGWGRTGLVAAGLAVLKGHKPEAAINLIRGVRPGSIETQQQERFIRTYYGFKSLKEELSYIFKL